ncbi:MAG: amidase [Syntrophaceae bacterium]|nr:amidase [Syntrophaceae bacterium]
MTPIPADPLAKSSISQFGVALREGKSTCEQATKAYLDRISALNLRLEAYVHVDDERALSMAAGLDRMLKGGTDLGPLMGVPVAIKDLLTVEGMPTRGGSRMNIEDIIQPEGRFIKGLKRAGCIILGKTRCTEFAAGAHNVSHPTPWNPTDLKVHKTPGGSSNGSAVAQAAGLCAFAIGSDTGGSVRLPASLCSLFGYKSSTKLWPLDGVLPLCPDMDSLGLFTNSAADAALVYSVLSDVPLPLTGKSPEGITLGVPARHFFENLHPIVQVCTDKAMSRLSAAGMRLVPVEMPEAEESVEIFAHLVPSDLIATLGRERFLAERDKIEPVVTDRLSHALDLSAESYVMMRRRLEELSRIGTERLQGLDGCISPTTPLLPVPVDECKSTADAVAFIARSLQNTRPGNIYDFCAATLPVSHLHGEKDPVGFQIHCAHGRDSHLLSLCMEIEQLLGRPDKPDMSRWR